MGKKNVLIVYAHQEPKSFNGALKDVAVETLRGQGHTVTISDLYEMKFDPTASKDQFKGKIIGIDRLTSENIHIHIRNWQLIKVCHNAVNIV